MKRTNASAIFGKFYNPMVSVGGGGYTKYFKNYRHIECIKISVWSSFADIKWTGYK